MNPSAWRDSLVAYIRAQARPVDKFGHMPRLYALAARVAQGIPHDDDILFAAAWMHDLGVFIGHRPEEPEALKTWNHVPYTIAQARALLPAWGFPSQKLDAVAEVIRTHQPQDDPVLIEAVILRDADILEQLGAIGALRALAKIGRDSRYPTFSSVLPVLRRALHALPANLRLTNAIALAAPKIQFLQSLIAAVDSEAGELLF